MTRPSNRLRRDRAGFTLLELLTALVVIGIAATVFFQLFLASVSLAESSRAREVAADLAQEYLTVMQASPKMFVWPNYDETAEGESLPVKAVAGSALGELFAQPAAMPTVRRPYNRERSLYNDFSWAASARLPEASARYVEITIEMTWDDSEGRMRRLALTSALPRSVAEGSGR